MIAHIPIYGHCWSYCGLFSRHCVLVLSGCEMSEWLVSWQANGKAWVTLEIKAKQHKMHKPNQSVQNFKADVMRKMNIFEHFELVESVSCSVVFNSLWPHRLQPTRLLCPWNSPGKNIGVGCHSLLQGIFLTQGLNPGLLHYRQFTLS